MQIADESPDRFGKSRELRSGFKNKAISPDGLDRTTGAFRGFEHKGAQPELLQAKGASQAGDARADDHDFFRVSRHK